MARELRKIIFRSGIEAVRAVFFDENRENTRFSRFPWDWSMWVRVCGCVRAWGCVGVCGGVCARVSVCARVDAGVRVPDFSDFWGIVSPTHTRSHKCTHAFTTQGRPVPQNLNDMAPTPRDPNHARRTLRLRMHAEILTRSVRPR